MPTANATKESAAVAVTNLGSWISVHTAAPGTTGASEATGGAPAYARKQTTWTPGASDGVVTGSEVTIDVPAGSYSGFGVWDAATGGNYIGGDTFTTATLNTQGQIKITPTYTQS